MLLGEGGAHHHAAHGENAVGRHVLPLLGQVQALRTAALLLLLVRDFMTSAVAAGLGQHTNVGLLIQHQRTDLLGGLPYDGHVLAGGEPVLGKQVIEYIFRLAPCPVA